MSLSVLFFSTLDVRTLFRLMSLADFVVCLLLLGYRETGTKQRLIRRFVCARVLHGVACILISLRGDISSLVSVYVANVTIFFSFALEVSTIVDTREHRRGVTRLLFGVATLGSVVFVLAATTPGLYVGYAAIIISALFGIAFAALAGDGEGSRLQRIIAGFYLLVSLAFLMRAYAGFGAGMGVFDAPPALSLGLLVMFGYCVGAGVGFLLLLKEDVDRRLLVAATIDSLTGILNRRAFFEAARERLARAAGRGEPASLLLVDIDHFKRVNDTFGHPAGDEVLAAVTERLHRALRAHDLFGRVGGEEFAVLLPEAEAEAIVVAERMRRAVRGLTTPATSHLDCSVSIGCASIAAGERATIETLFRRGDAGLYAAKRAGRNRVVAAGADLATVEMTAQMAGMPAAPRPLDGAALSFANEEGRGVPRP
ncbi:MULTISPECIES: GGDEF domain-containing protein [Xanthobacter]|uniref:diguanylate cyclase n=1 Tax=Xanthobacter aminoxidans TaxID=186280 RepID=A0ABW6ZI97_9HYPH